MVFEDHKKIIDNIKSCIGAKPTFRQLQALMSAAQYVLEEFPEQRTYCFKISKYVKSWLLPMFAEAGDERMMDSYWGAMLFEAPHIFESYMLYTESLRDPAERFYAPRQEQFIKIGAVGAMQDLEDGLYDILGLSLPPGTGKTTLGEFFLSWVMGKHPLDYNLMSSHSGYVTDMFHGAVRNLITSKEYRWGDVFPGIQVDRINEKESTINLVKYKPFPSLTCRAIGASQTGVTRCNGYLYADDLCSGIEEALSKQRLDKLNTRYSTDLKTRKKEGCKEIHVATRWSVWDVIGSVQRQYENNPRARFIAVPDINPKTGESNFEFKHGVGFSVQYFTDIADSLDDVTYRCLFKNEPIEREGILYHPDELRRYFGDLPAGEPDGIIAICDTKDTGKDYNVLGVFYIYGQDYYLHDIVCKNIDPYTLDDLNAECLVKNKVQIARFESNKEGSRTADKVAEKVKAKGGCCSIQKKLTTQNKETKIIVNSPWVKEHVIFKDASLYKPKDDYGVAMAMLTGYSQLAKNPNDDVPDMLAMLALYANTGTLGKVTPMQRPF